jgi:hypothetical protein
MDIIDNAINQRIMSGSFPTEKLFPASIEAGRDIDILAHAEPTLEMLKHNPDLLFLFFTGFSKKVKELDLLQRPEGYIQDVNYLINAKCSEDYLLIDGSLQAAANLCPVVTPLDKTMWFGAYAFSMEIALNQDAPIEESTNMMFAWIHLLHLAQEMEIKTGLTIEIEDVRTSTQIFDFLNGKYEESKPHGVFRQLTKDEIDGLHTLSKKRIELLSEIEEERRLAEETAKKTDREWEIFLQIVNDLSEREAVVINKICDAVSSKDKIRAIQDYYSVLYGIEKGHYALHGEDIILVPVFEAVNERMNKASTYASAFVEESTPFRIHPALFSLAMNPKTYNYLFMSFHHFRLDPSKDTAKRFFSLALTCIKRNLGGDEREWISLSEMIKDFYTTVFNYMQENKSTIEHLSFSRLLKNVVAVEGASFEAAEASELYKELWSAKLREYLNSDAYEKDIANFADLNTPTLGIDELLTQVNDAESEIAQLENEVNAKKIIVSLNIIYLFCDGLRIVLSNKHGNIKIKSREDVEKYRRYLLNLDDQLVHTVYAHMDEHEIGMLEYREMNGVFSFTLSEQEAQEEACRNSIFSGILKDSIETLAVGIESKNAEQILDTNRQIRSEILRFPDCDAKQQYASWLDSISSRICSALVENCKKQKDDYKAVKQGILTSLGSKSGILPSSTVDTLTTAEILYARYASDDYAREGFDFSCISALYYQAFEEAYNDLIWSGYATKLNGLEIRKGVKYTDILDLFRNGPITDPSAQGYLDDNCPSQRGYYVQYKNRKNPQTTIKSSLMYTNFAILMKNIANPSKLNGFCDYFARLTGFSGRAEMFLDTPFMLICSDFIKNIDQSSKNRNNASHGGSLISITQCTADKKTVLNDLEAVRSTSIGLVQQLLYILQKD